MNFLAHLFLSGNDAEIRLGNFIGDYVKGKRFDMYPAKVQQGIWLHRAIDALTDSHPSTKICTNILKPGLGRYSGVATDVLFDHVLALEWENYSKRNLENFTRTFYLQLLQHFHILPPPVRRFLPFMIQSDRLYSYKSEEGIHHALEIMSNHTSLPGKAGYVLEQFNINAELFKLHFRLLFSDLINQSTSKFQITIGN